VAIVTQAGATTGPDMADKGKQITSWPRKVVIPPPTFNPQKEKKTFVQARKEFIATNVQARKEFIATNDWEASTSTAS